MPENKIQVTRCADMAELIAKKYNHRLNAEEAGRLTAHLDDCRECRTAAPFWMRLHERLDASAVGDLIPDPQLQRQLRRHLRQRHHPARRGIGAAWHGVQRLLNVRVPLYQAALGILFLLALFYLGDPLPPNPGESAAPFQNVQFLADSTERSDTLQIDTSRQPGRSIKDDSLLSRFITPVL